MKKLVDVTTFGAIDADSDDMLIDCFEDHEAFLELVAFRRFLIVGRKGSGKTAIFKQMLHHKDPEYFCFGHTFSDYPWGYHDKQARSGVPDFDKFTHSWKYLVLLTISKIVLNQDQSLPINDASADAMSLIEQFVIDSYGTRDPDVTQIFTPKKQLRFHVSAGLKPGGLGFEIGAGSVPIENLPTHFPEVNKTLLKAVLTALNPNHRYYILFDQLDLGFNPTEPEYYNRLIGLLLACRDINLEARSAKCNLCVAVFLRDDIYDCLLFEDKNKLTQNYLSAIEWDSPRTKKTLRRLMEKRFTRVLGDVEHQVIAWDQVFDETQEMSGHQSKYRHMLDRTCLRPRDIIRFTNEILVQYKHRAASGEEVKGLFENKDINNAHVNYSDYFLRELVDEVHKHMPAYKNYLEVLKAIGCLQFARKDFDAAYAEKKEPLKLDKPPVEVLKGLFEFSIIGHYKAGGGGYGGATYVFRYADIQARFDENAPYLRVHPGLMEVLGLKKFSK